MVRGKCLMTEGKREPQSVFYMHPAAPPLQPCEHYHVLSGTAGGMNSVLIIFEPLNFAARGFFSFFF